MQETHLLMNIVKPSIYTRNKEIIAQIIVK